MPVRVTITSRFLFAVAWVSAAILIMSATSCIAMGGGPGDYNILEALGFLSFILTVVSFVTGMYVAEEKGGYVSL